jgi:hypothetical protein
MLCIFTPRLLAAAQRFGILRPLFDRCLASAADQH